MAKTSGGAGPHAAGKAPAKGGPAKPKPVTRYSAPAGRRICELIEAGKATRQIARMEEMPSESTIYRWRDAHPDFAVMLARARDIASDAAVEAALEIAAQTTKETVAADRLKINTLLWRASHGAPRRWGGKGEAGGAAGASEEKVAPRRIDVRIRRFVAAQREDGTPVTREILADGSTVDHDG